MLKLSLSLFLLVCFLKPVKAQDANIKEYLNISYISAEVDQEDTLRQLNLVVPTEVNNPSLLIWIGGGAWSFVDRNVELPLARQFAKQGIAVAVIGHRLSSGIWKDPKRTTGVKHPAHVPLAQAVRWLSDQADQYGYDANWIFVGGYSSGAHLAALLSLDSRYLKQVKLDRSILKGVIPVAGAYDINSYYHGFFQSENSKHLAEQHVKAVFGETKEQFEQASPTSYVSEISVPMFIDF